MKSYLQVSIRIRYLQLPAVPQTLDLAVFVATMTTTGHNQSLYPCCTCARDNNITSDTQKCRVFLAQLEGEEHSCACAEKVSAHVDHVTTYRELPCQYPHYSYSNEGGLFLSLF